MCADIGLHLVNLVLDALNFMDDYILRITGLEGLSTENLR